MSGTFFDYEPGRIDARFSHDSKFDHITLDIRMGGDATISTNCDDGFHLAVSENHKKDDMEFQVYVSSVFCPFGDFIRFLEAITIGVQECSFEWDSEGPDGKMHWKRRHIQDTGFLTVDWHSSKKNFSYRMMLNRWQVVGALYTAFRTFAESPDYDPLRYEELAIGESFALVLSNATLDDLAGALVRLNAAAAETVIQRLRDAVGGRHTEGPKMNFPIEFFLESTETGTPPREFYMPWIHPEWRSWSIDQRLADLTELFGDGYSSWHGANLRELRSKLVEDWLAFPEPPTRQSDRPRRI